MPQLLAALKDEIRRLARKEMKTQAAPVRKAAAQHRREIAALKRQIVALNRKVNFVQKRVPAEQSVAPEALDAVRFSAKSVRAQRARLGISALDYGKLVGVSSLTIYNWEHGKSRPRKQQLAGLVAVRNIGKREALQRLAG